MSMLSQQGQTRRSDAPVRGVRSAGAPGGRAPEIQLDRDGAIGMGLKAALVKRGHRARRLLTARSPLARSA